MCGIVDGQQVFFGLSEGGVALKYLQSIYYSTHGAVTCNQKGVDFGLLVQL